MKTSRTVSEISQVDKTIYPKCNMKKEHEKEALNLICLTKNCKFHGPICVLCKKQHAGHNVVTIKSFVTLLGEAQKKMPVMNMIEQKLEIEQKTKQKNPSERLQEAFRLIMGMLNLQVQQLSEQIKKAETKFIQDYQKVKIELEEQNDKGESLQQCLQFFVKKQFQDGIEFRRYISKALKNVSIGAKNEVTVQVKKNEIVREYQNKIELYKDNLFVIQTQIKELFQSINEKGMRQKVQKIVDMNFRPKTATVSILKSQNITFSPSLKASNIVIQKQGKVAKLKDNSANKIVFFQNAISAKIYQTTVKIVNIVGNISLGIAFKQKIKQKSFTFDKNVNGHGAYFIVSNTFKYNSSIKTEDGVSTPFSFGANDQIHMALKVKEKKLVFTVNNDDKKITSLNLKSLPQLFFKEIEFCACMTAMGDKIQII